MLPEPRNTRSVAQLEKRVPKIKQALPHPHTAQVVPADVHLHLKELAAGHEIFGFTVGHTRIIWWVAEGLNLAFSKERQLYRLLAVQPARATQHGGYGVSPTPKSLSGASRFKRGRLGTCLTYPNLAVAGRNDLPVPCGTFAFEASGLASHAQRYRGGRDRI